MVEVGAVGLIAGGMGEKHVGVFRRQRFAGVHVTPGGSKDDIAALFDALVHGILNSGGIRIVDVVLAHDLLVAQAQSFLHGHDPLVMGIAVAGTSSGIADVDHTHLDVFHCDTGALAAGRLLIVAAVAAAGQKHSCQCNGATQSKNSFHF